MGITSVGTIGKIYLVPDDEPFYFKDGNLTWINDYKDITPVFVYNFLRSDNARRQIDSVLIGSTQKALTIVNINKLAIVKPSLVVLKEFTKQAQSIFNQITINTEQTRMLEKTRDTLLPKLLSGELDV
jgi:type I restriction enzyme, S subunit